MKADERRIIAELAAIRAELDELACRISQITSALETPQTPERQADLPDP